MYSYTCPRCDTSVEFRNRITQRKRNCPHCGKPVTVAEIDRQEAEAAHQRLAIGLILGGFCLVCGILTVVVMVVTIAQRR